MSDMAFYRQLTVDPSNLRFTGIWMKQSGRWQEVAHHANIVPAQ